MALLSSHCRSADRVPAEDLITGTRAMPQEMSWAVPFCGSLIRHPGALSKEEQIARYANASACRDSRSTSSPIRDLCT